MAVPVQPVQPGRPVRRSKPDTSGLTRQQKQEADDKSTAWAFVWTLFAFKLITALVIWIVAARSSEATQVLGATHWFWLLIPIIAFAGPLAYQTRVRRVRRRREALQRAEWLVSSRPGAAPDVEALKRAEWSVD